MAGGSGSPHLLHSQTRLRPDGDDAAASVSPDSHFVHCRLAASKALPDGQAAVDCLIAADAAPSSASSVSNRIATIFERSQVWTEA